MNEENNTITANLDLSNDISDYLSYNFIDTNANYIGCSIQSNNSSDYKEIFVTSSQIDELKCNVELLSNEVKELKKINARLSTKLYTLLGEKQKENYYEKNRKC